MTELDLSLRTDTDTPSEPVPAAPDVFTKTRPAAARPALFLAEMAVALAWLYDGLWCKLLRGCPHVDAVLGGLPSRLFGYADALRYGAGALEALLALWVLSRKVPRLAALAQAAVLVGLSLAAYRLAPAHILDPGRFVVEKLAFLALITLVASRRSE